MDTDDATGRGSRAAAPDAVGPIRVDAEPLRYEPALDGIRAVAVLAVMAFHFLGAEYFGLSCRFRGSCGDGLGWSAG